jgi:thiol-disulfide isomerase/thioredoxin
MSAFGQPRPDELALGYQHGIYRAVLQSPGGELPFILKMDNPRGNLEAWVINGSEQIRIATANLTGIRFTLSFGHYDSLLELDTTGAVGVMKGSWKKRNSADQWTTMEAYTERCDGYRFKPNFKITEEVVNYAPVSGRWAVKFTGDAEPSVGGVKEGENKSVEGTFLTTTGDYRYLAGSYEYGLLRLSCFDGAHAFLFHANMQPDGTLKGDFWSGPKYHDTWTAKRDDKAALPDGFTLTKINPKARLKDLKFRDLDGKERSLAEPGLIGKATIVEVFGSWCPNCHDAADLLVELEKTHGPRGLKIVGLAFEATGDSAHDAKQVRCYLERHKATYPVLLAGTRDKDKASAALPVIEKLKAYPTFLFVDGDGVVRSVYTGFSGPATGDEYGKLRGQFERLIEKMLAD